MKKTIIAILAVFMVLTLVSCATTGAEDIPDRVREVELVDLEGAPLSAEDAFKIISLYLEDDEELQKTSKVDKQAMTIVLEDFTLGGNVGFAAQDGEIVVRLTLKAEAGKATITVSYVDSYTTIYLGPIPKKVSMGLTELGMKEYDIQVGYILDTFEASFTHLASVINYI